MNIKTLPNIFWCLLAGIFLMGCKTSQPEALQNRGITKTDFTRQTPIDPASDRSSKMELEHSLAGYLEYAALLNPGLRSKFMSWKAALQRIPQVRALPDPKFNYGYFISEVETRVGPQNHRVGVAQSFPWFGTLSLREDKASEEAKIAGELFEAEKLDLFYQVKSAFYEYYYLGQALNITRQNIELLKNLEGVAHAKVRAGGEMGAVLQAQIEIGKLEDRLKALNEMKAPLLWNLSAAIGLKVESRLPLPKSISFSQVTVDWNRLSTSINDTNHTVQSLKHQKKSRSIDVALAKKKFYPDVQLGVDYIVTGESVNPAISDSGKDPIMAMFSVNIPLWFGKKRAALDEAQNNYNAVKANLQDTANKLHADFKLAVFEFLDAERKISLYQTTLMTLAQNSLNVARESYERGRVDFSELIDAQQLLLEFQLSYERSRVDHEISLANLERILGKQLPRDLQIESKPRQ